MISRSEAERIILSKTTEYGTELIPLQDSLGRVLADDLAADRDFPPFDRVMMDGIAIAFEQWSQGSKTFQIQGTAAAGIPRLTLSDTAGCIEVMTGAILPVGTNTVIPVEQLTIEEGKVVINTDSIQKGQNVHLQGSDKNKGTTVLHTGTMITAAEAGILATLGVVKVPVKKLPKTIIISTGDELIPIEETPLAHQIRRSNSYQLAMALKGMGINATMHHINDEKERVIQEIGEFIQQYDLIILTGGVSKGKFDFVPDALRYHGVNQLFHGVKQRPGKPFWFGEKGNVKVFALPGNPVSTFMCLTVYLIPWIKGCLGLNTHIHIKAKLAENIDFRPDLTYFLEVSLSVDSNGLLWATPQKGSGSGDLGNLSEADGFMEFPQGRDQFHSGEVFNVYPYRNIF